MKTKKEILAILETNSHNWCEELIGKIKEYLVGFPNDTPLVDMLNGVTSEWAFYWGRDIGDREIMRERVTESKWAYFWARQIGDREIR